MEAITWLVLLKDRVSIAFILYNFPCCFYPKDGKAAVSELPSQASP